ncbi:acyltransferase family protein [Flavobacterium sp.]|uniref:acyltransferase family protein n=1 Tax=Flavobacterium sp. TaxID=239 RepID=UPI003D0B2DA5
MITKKKYFASLTGIRAIAAYMVYLNHFFLFHPVFSKTTFTIFNELHIGVTIFFVLSGFLICYRYFDYEHISFKAFMKKRFARIYPMYFILTTITFICFAIYKAQYSMTYLKIYLLNITFLRGFFQDYIYSGVGQGWSLTVEEMFYFLAPVFFILIKRKKFFLFIIPVVFIGLGMVLVYLFGEINNLGFKTFGLMKTNLFMLNLTFFGRITEFFIGIGLALFVKKYQDNFRTKFVTAIGITVIIICVYLLMILKVGNGDGKDCYTGVVINNLMLPLFGIAPLFWGLITEKTSLAKILSTPLFVLLGKSSYTFYLIHVGVFVTLVNKISANFVFEFIVLNLVSIFLYLYVETPLNDRFRER